jgi:uncharacterized protein YndB with AHSA1/START domain
MTTTAQHTEAPASNDRIEKVLDLRAPRSRVWRALSDAGEFAAWFGIELDGGFAEGATVKGDVTHADGRPLCTVEMQIERIEAERYMAYRWHPYPIDPSYDYSAEPMTLVEFTLEDTESGTRLTIVESGFDGIPLARRAEAFRANTGGWEGQSRKLAAYVE